VPNLAFGVSAFLGYPDLRLRRLGGIVITVSFALVLTGTCIVVRPDRAALVASGFVSQTLCSAQFVSGLDPDAVYAETLRPMGGMRFIDWAIRYQVDPSRREVTTTLAGLFRSRSVYREGLGCLIVHGALPSVSSLPISPVAPRIVTPPIVAPSSERLKAAFDRIFARRDLGTKAIVVMHEGQVVAERYAAGYDADTPLRGWSVAKSVVSALIGILVREGRLRIDQPAPVPAWHDPQDPRRAITIDNLLRMTSGLAIEETLSGFDPVSRMLMVERDMAGFAERARLEAAPGSRWRYTSGNTLILCRIIRDSVGGKPEDVVRFARRELFDPLGMASVTLEFDAAGTPTDAVFATARDWALFGQLYLDDGVAGKRRILPTDWVAYSTTPTLGRGYGAGFWLGGPTWRPDWPMPSDAFYAAGHLHQKLLIVPSRRLVIARFGVTHASDDGFGYLAEEVLGALQESEQRNAARGR